MDGYITHRVAAEILGCHLSNVPKLIRKGHLHSRGHGRRGSLVRAEVEALAQQRASQRDQPPAAPRPQRQPLDRRPDKDHDWLSPQQVADLIGTTSYAVLKRVSRGTLPGVRTHGRIWVRRDHLEAIEAARISPRTTRAGTFSSAEHP